MVNTASSTRTIAFSETSCRASAALLRLHPTCWERWRRTGPKATASPCRSMTSRGAIGIRTWFASRLRSRTWNRTVRRDFLNSSNVDVVSVQHEFGIYGGPAGSHLLTLLRGLSAPVVTTLHTVLRTPNADQLRVMRELIAHSTRLVVMTGARTKPLAGGVPGANGQDRSHPAWYSDVPFVAPDHYKEQFGVDGRRVLLTFGLLSPNKGIEQVLNALPDIVAEFPTSSTSCWAHASQRAAHPRRQLPARPRSPRQKRTNSRTTSCSTTALWS